MHTFTPQIIHGDLKGVSTLLCRLDHAYVGHGNVQVNVLISDAGEAVLGDFGVATVVVKDSDQEEDDEQFRGSVRWMAPELVATDPSSTGTWNITPATDVYAFGCLILEVCILCPAS